MPWPAPSSSTPDGLPADADAPPLRYRDGWLGAAEADRLLALLSVEVPWRQERIRMMGREVLQPRLTAWYGDPGTGYRYSGLRLSPLPFTPALAALRDRAAAAAAADMRFNSVLLNLYRDGADSVSWHSDDEPELGPDPIIASVSLGGTRRFDLRHRDRHEIRAALDLGHGSLLVMGESCQIRWQHRIAKTRRPTAPRINLTFRRIVPGASAPA